MLYNLLTATVDGESSSAVIDSSSPMEGSSVLDSSVTTSEESTTSNPSSPDTNPTGGCFSSEKIGQTLFGWAIIIGLLVWFYFRNKKQMKMHQEYMDRRNNIKPGNKVVTVGGITGTVVEVSPEDNTFVLETGDDTFGKSYLRFDKRAIHETDVDMSAAEPQPEPTEETAPEAEQEDELFNEENKPEQPVEETPAEETTDAE